MIDQYPVFDEVEDVIKISQISDVDYLSSVGEKNKERETGFNKLVRADQRELGWVVTSGGGGCVSPDEVDVVIKSSAQAPGRHLVQPEDWLVWVCDPGSTGKSCSVCQC